MVERGEGYLINTASAAGPFSTQVSSLIYSVTKHAAVSLAEWLSIEYADRGVKISCICPQGVRTPMLELAMEEPPGAAALTRRRGDRTRGRRRRRRRGSVPSAP